MLSRAEFVQVLTSVDSKRMATAISMKLLAKRLASCVQVTGPVTSHYWWKGRVEHAREWFCLIKAREKDYRRVEAAIRQMHPYEIPEITALPVVYGNSEYLRWIKKETVRRVSR